MDAKTISWTVLLFDLVLLLGAFNIVSGTVPEHVCCYIKKLLTSLEGSLNVLLHSVACLHMHLHVYIV